MQTHVTFPLRTTGVAMICLAFATMTTSSLHATIITNLYDFEAATSPVTEPGWVHIDPTTVGGPNTPGLLPAAGNNGYVAFDRGSSTQAPELVTRDAFLGKSLASTIDPVIVFRDIIPANAVSVQLTIYRSDSLDIFAPDFTTRISVDGGALSTIDTGISTLGTIFAPITATIALSGNASPGTLDLHFFDNVTGTTNTRINGIEATYTIPEPSTLVLASFAAFGLYVLRRKQCHSFSNN